MPLSKYSIFASCSFSTHSTNYLNFLRRLCFRSISTRPSEIVTSRIFTYHDVWTTTQEISIDIADSNYSPHDQHVYLRFSSHHFPRRLIVFSSNVFSLNHILIDGIWFYPDVPLTICSFRLPSPDDFHNRRTLYLSSSARLVLLCCNLHTLGNFS